MKATIFSAAPSLLLCTTLAFAAAPQGGVFIPRNGGVEGCLDKSHVFFDTRAGGVMRPVAMAWPKLQALTTLEAVMVIKPADAGAPFEVRQSYDANPELDYLEEGSQRIGLRVKFRFYDRQNTYYGHGMTETWLYPDGQAFVAAGVTAEGLPPGATVIAARLEAKVPESMSVDAPAALASGAALRLNDQAIPGRYVLIAPKATGLSTGGVAIYWRTGTMEHNDFVYRTEKGAPYYYRWPDYFRQAYTGVPLHEVALSGDHLELRWPVAAPGRGGKQTADFSAVLRLARVPELSRGEAAAKALVDAERTPVKLAVTGGVIHGSLEGYNDQEGAYEVRKTGTLDQPMTVTLPADPAARTIAIKAIGLTGHGAVTADLDGKPQVLQLTSDGGIADDPLAPIHEHPEAPADTAILNVKLGPAAQTLTLREQDGVQFVYECRDPGRHIAVYSTKTGGTCAGLRFSLADGHARDMRAYGHEDCALTENLFHWFSYCGYTPGQMLDQLRDFVILKNGPDEAVFRYTSANADDGAQSQFVVRVPAAAPAMTIDVNATFTVLKSWPYASSQFFDVFPFRGVWPRDWWYAETLWLAPDGRWKTRRTVEQTFEGDQKLETLTGGGFFGLYSSDRGNMLMLTHHFSPELPTNYVICGNYIDYHMDVQLDPPGTPGTPGSPGSSGPKGAALPKGFQTSVDYELAVWGDKKVTRQQMIEIGKKSIAAQHLVIPE